MMDVTRLWAKSCGIRILAVAMAVCLGVALVSCGRTKPVTPELPTISIKGNVLHVELARTDTEHQRGLQERTKLADDAGMLFIFDAPLKPESFWMDKTLIPLSIAFMDDKGVITQIENMEPMTKTGHWSREAVRYALEVNQGWFERHRIKVGDVVDLTKLPVE